MLKVTRVERDSVTLQWFAPFSDGGAEIKKYVIMKKQVGLDLWEEIGRVGGNTTTYTVDGLRENKQYYFGVYAVSKAGKGEIAETLRPTTLRRVMRKWFIRIIFCKVL